MRDWSRARGICQSTLCDRYYALAFLAKTRLTRMAVGRNTASPPMRFLPEWLKIPESKRSTGDAVRLTGVMRRLGWSGPDRMYLADARRLRGYRRPA